MTEWIAIIAVLVVVVFFIGILKVTYNIATGADDLFQYFGNAGRPGTMREQHRPKKNKVKNSKWGKDGKKI